MLVSLSLSSCVGPRHMGEREEEGEGGREGGGGREEGGGGGREGGGRKEVRGKYTCMYCHVFRVNNNYTLPYVLYLRSSNFCLTMYMYNVCIHTYIHRYIRTCKRSMVTSSKRLKIILSVTFARLVGEKSLYSGLCVCVLCV